MSDPTTPAAPEEPTPSVPAATPEAPATPEPAAAAPAGAAPAGAAPAANPYAAPAAPGAPAGAYAPAGGYATAAPVKQTLSLIAFIAGLVGLLLSLAGGFGFLPALAAVILGFMGKKKEPQAPKWMWLTGIITGFVGMGISLIWGILWVVATLLPLLMFGAAVGEYY